MSFNFFSSHIVSENRLHFNLPLFPLFPLFPLLKKERRKKVPGELFLLTGLPGLYPLTEGFSW
jgi:hypothetical protein